MLRALVGVFVGGALLLAEQAYPLRELVIEGAEVYDEQRIRDLTGLEIGQPVTEADFQEALRRLDDAGVFENLAYQFGPKDGGYRLVFEVDEVDQLYPLRLEGFDASRDTLLEKLRSEVPLFNEIVPATGTMVDRIGDALQRHWLESGNEEKITGRLAPIDADRLAMVYQPARRLKSIAFVTFEGSEVIPPIDLQRVFNPIAMGEPYSETRLKELLHANIRILFEERGHMGVEFCPCTTEPDPDSTGLLVQVEVDDGPSYSFGDIELPSPPGMDFEDLQEIFAMKSGDTANMGLVRDAQGELDEALKKQGYLKAASSVDVDVNHESQTVNLAFAVTPGEQYAFDRVEIKGLDILSEPVIRKRWGLKAGDPFNPDYPPYFLSRIEEEQMFDNLKETRWSMDINEFNNTVQVTLTFVGGEKEDEFEPVIEKNTPF